MLRSISFSLLLIGCGATTPKASTHAEAQAKAKAPRVLPKTTPAQVQQARGRIKEAQRVAATLTPAGFARRYPPAASVTRVSYSPKRARHLGGIRKAFGGMSPKERRAFARNGFVVQPGTLKASYGATYDRAFHAHVPVVVTSDSILYAFHDSYDDILIEFETEVAIPELEQLLRRLHRRLRAAKGELPEGLRRAGDDLDAYLTVGRVLLGASADGVVDTTQGRVERLIAAVKAEAPTNARVIGPAMDLDFSMFKPRGHYTQSEALSAYFQAMSWVQRIPLRATDRDAANAIVLLASVMDEEALQSWKRIDELLLRMVGEQDDALFPSVREAVAHWTSDLDAYLATPDADVAGRFQELLAGKEAIASELVKGGEGEAAVNPGSLYLIGQRFVLDSHVLSEVVYDRLKSSEGQPIHRMEPSVMDAQFVLGSNTAGTLLAEDLAKWRYHARLHTLRAGFDALPPGEWGTSIYRAWLGAIRSLNFHELPDALPPPLRTKAWQYKTLNTQLASWAELRRDNILYAKQSFTAVPTCGFPDVYVEPVPQFFSAMAQLHHVGSRLVAVAPERMRGKLDAFFERGIEITSRLESIARDELRGASRSRADALFLKRLIDSTWEEGIGCAGRWRERVDWDGWYTELFYRPRDAFEFEPVIADVHTTPAGAESGAEGTILHAATTPPSTLVLTIPDKQSRSCAYVGPVSDYRTVKTENFTRITDEGWKSTLHRGIAPDPAPWQREFMPD